MLKVHHADYHKFSVDAGRWLSFESTWRVSSRPPVDNDSFLAEVRLWAGSAGDYFRIGAPDGTPVELIGITVESVSIDFPSAGEAEVRFKAAGIELDNSDVPESLSETLGSDGERRKKAVFRIAGEIGVLPPLPVLGTPFDWAGEAFVCESAESKSIPGGFECSISCRQTGVRLIRGPELVRDADSEESENASYFVPASDYPAFIAGLKIDDPVPWGSPEKVIRKISGKYTGPLGYEVTVEGRKIITKMLDCQRSERFDGYDDVNRIRRELVWKSRWRVRAEDLASFENLAGSEASWAASNTVITEVTPRKVSALEYELAIEAQALTNQNLFQNYSGDDRSNLQGRSDVNAELIDFLVTPEMAGYLRGENGAYVDDPDFDPDSQCPFLPAEILDPNLVNTVLKTILITDTRYHSGSLRNNLGDMVNWAYSNRVTTERVAGCSGSFLKIDIDLRELADNFGNRWTRFTASYQMAPPGMKWNPSYWRNK